MPRPNTHPTSTRGTNRAARSRHRLRSTAALDPDQPPSAPSLGRAVPLPGGRAVVGALLITVAAVGVFAAYRSANDGPTTPVVVVAADVPAGHRLQASDVRLDRAELPVAAAGNVFSSIDAVSGGMTLAPLRGGELVQRSALLAPGAGDAPAVREFSFAVDRERAVNGAIQQGERVDVLATFGTGEGAYTSVVARDVHVVQVDAGGKSNAIGASGKLTITVSLAGADDVLRLAHGTEVAPVTLVRATRAAGGDPGTIDTYRAPGGKVDSKSPAPAPTTTTTTTGQSSPSSSTSVSAGSSAPTSTTIPSPAASPSTSSSNRSG